MSELFKKVAAFLDRDSRHLALHGVVPAARPFFAAALARRLARPILVVTPNSRESEIFAEELRFFLPAAEAVLHFPAWEVLPFEPLSPATEISARRIATLKTMCSSPSPVVVAPLEAVLQFLISKGKLVTAAMTLKKGGTLNERRFFRHLLEGGYRRGETVEVLGEFSQRGGIIDFYPPGSPAPVRVELFGDEIDSLHLFDPESQRSGDEIEGVEVPPVREIILDGGVLGALKPHLPDGGEGGDILTAAADMPGLEHYQAALTRSRQTILDYFTEPPLIVVSEYSDLEARAEQFRQEVRQEAQRALLPGLYDPDRAYLDFERWKKGLLEQSVLYLDSFGLAPPDCETIRVESSGGRSFVLSGRSDSAGESPLESTVCQVKGRQAQECILLVGATEEAARRLGTLCGEHGLGTRDLPPADVPAFLDDPRPGPPHVTSGSLREGFRLPDQGVTVIAEEDIFGAKIRRPAPARKKAFMPDFHLLKAGDFLVHIDHGIGAYGGLTKMPAGDDEADFLVIIYQGGDKVYVPVHAMDAVQRYVSWEGNQPRLDKLGGRMWTATKRKVKKALVTLARDLLQLYAVRQSTEGHPFSPDTPWQTEFEMGFEYTETEDQLQAIVEVKGDMEQPNPMDRLVCGDVGYGKTEVAMRAAFKAVQDSKQVALLAPTTILVQQHLTTFRKRFGPFPVRVEMLSRFVKRGDQKEIVADVARGGVDILIGTHRLLGKDVSFHDLGLVIIDEEQRFGVRHKEALKEMRRTVDVLSLTATPIPRTLYLSVSGIRELSQIATPPENRLAVKNTVSPFDAELIREAVLREVRRGGQVFFIHNRVRTIGGIASYLQRLLPEVRIAVAHGQMNERALEKIVSAFRDGEYDLLLSTTIVESGLDIPNANTMFVNRADAFGLSDLYQLRGRIGRSRHRAYAYFLVPREGSLSGAARKRIEVIRDFAHLGAGFQIALYDLEIRGAGSVLGYRQSGHIANLGFDLYTKLLRETIRELQGEPAVEEHPVKISLSLPTFIPDNYMESINKRLSFYKRIADASSEEDLEAVAGEMRERFGALPGPVHSLLQAARLKIAAEQAGLASLTWSGSGLEIAFHNRSAVSGEKIVAALQAAPPGSRMRGEDRFYRAWEGEGTDDRFAEALGLLQSLG